MTTTPLLAGLQKWYRKQCDGDWEHGAGITIATLDNPGWSVTIDLEGTEAELRLFEPLKVQRTEEDWYECLVSDKRFRAFGGPTSLEEILRIFIGWVEDS